MEVDVALACPASRRMAAARTRRTTRRKLPHGIVLGLDGIVLGAGGFLGSLRWGLGKFGSLAAVVVVVVRSWALRKLGDAAGGVEQGLGEQFLSLEVCNGSLGRLA